MSFLSKLWDKPTLSSGASSAASGTRTAAVRTMEHVRSLSALFQVEVAEYVGYQCRRGAYVVSAAALLLVSYLLLCALAVVLLEPHVGLVASLALILAGNLIIAMVLLVRAAALGKERFAPATREELQNDWQCLKLLLKGNEKS